MSKAGNMDGVKKTPKSLAKTIQVRLSAAAKKKFVQLCQRINDEIEREERQMGIGPMASYAACYLVTLTDDQAIQVVRRGKQFFDEHPIPDEPSASTAGGLTVKGDGDKILRPQPVAGKAIPPESSPEKVNRGSRRRPKRDNARTASTH